MQEEKQRHGCLTAYLIFMIIASLLSSASYIFASELIFSQFPDAPSWAGPVLIVLGLLNIVLAIALFMWKKWGFYGALALSVVTFFVNLAIGIGIGQALFGLIGIAILFGVLQIGDKNKGWPQLE